VAYERFFRSLHRDFFFARMESLCLRSGRDDLREDIAGYVPYDTDDEQRDELWGWRNVHREWEFVREPLDNVRTREGGTLRTRGGRDFVFVHGPLFNRDYTVRDSEVEELEAMGGQVGMLS
jgi:hypothetical protein